MKTLLLGACTVGLLSVGCLQERTYLDPEQNVGFNSTADSTMQLRDGSLRGDFGSRRGFNGEATQLDGSNDAAYGMTVVNVVRSQQEVGAAMVILSISGRTLDKFEVGEHSFQYDESSANREEQVYVNVCGGSDSNSFDYDAPADHGTLTIEDTPDGLRNVQIHTETPTIDPATGTETGTIETSDSAFGFVLQR